MIQMKTLNMKSIRTKLICSFIALCLIPIISIGIASYLKATSILGDKLKVTTQQTLSEINQGLDGYFSSMDNEVIMMANNNNFVNVDEAENLPYINELLKSAKEADPDIFSAYYGTESGKFTIYPVQKMPEGFNHKVRPWYQQAMAHKEQVIITLPFKDAATGKSVVSIAKTVVKDGKVVGVAAMNISLETLSNSIAKSKVGVNGYVFLADPAGKIIAHPNSAIVGTDAAAKQSFWKDTKVNDTGFINYTYENQGKFGAYVTNKYTGWKLVATLPDSELIQDTKAIRNLNAITSIIVIIFAVILSLLLSNGIAGNIKKMKRSFSMASKGDLTAYVKIKSKDEFQELGDDFNSMMTNISSLMKSVEQSSRTVLQTSASLAVMAGETTASVGEVSKAIEEVAEGATHQAQKAEESVEGIEVLSGKLDGISSNAIEMNQLSTDAQRLSSNGLSMVNTLIEKSSRTRNATIQVNEVVHEMNNSTTEINAISDTISQITKQTNLLSLNASIEAARAGEAGRGFSVVADEIRKLAEQSQSATVQIKNIIENIQKKSITAVKAMEETKSIVTEQDTAVVETQKIFHEIMSAISTITAKVTHIEEAVIDINSSKHKVAAQIDSISSISEETASATEEVSASTEEINATMDEFTRYAEDLKRLSEQLGEEISRFKL